jgi:hypothetical protein
VQGSVDSTVGVESDGVGEVVGREPISIARRARSSEASLTSVLLLITFDVTVECDESLVSCTGRTTSNKHALNQIV